MKRKLIKAITASVISAAMMTTAITASLPSSALAQETQLLGETTFDYKCFPWQTVETAPARQTFSIEDGTLHLRILVPRGESGEKWDLQLRHRNLSFRKGHTYEVKFKAKSRRDGMELDTHIGNLSGTEEYFCINGEEMQMGAAMGGNWGKPCILSANLYKTFSGKFTPTEDLDNVEWTFHYAAGTLYAGNAIEGDEIWFDEMSIVDLDETTDPVYDFGYTHRDAGGLENNYISVNQLGYFPDLEKKATLGDNKGDQIHNAGKIEIGDEPLPFELINANTGKPVFKGKTQPMGADRDSGDNVHIIDFSKYTTPGRYYLRCGEWRSYEFDISSDIYSRAGHNMLTDAVNYFYQNRSGEDIESKYITSGDRDMLARQARDGSSETAVVQKQWVRTYADSTEAAETYRSKVIDSHGGWYDSGDNINYSKSVVKGGITLWTLMNMYERAADTQKGREKFGDASGAVITPEGKNKIPDILDECLNELDFMKRLVVESDDPVWGKYAGLVYHCVQDHKWSELAARPMDYIGNDYQMVRIAKPPTFAATLNFAACAAQASRLLKDCAPKKAQEYLSAAKASYEAFKEHYHEYTSDEDMKVSQYIPYHDLYGNINFDGDTEVMDEFYWAACELFAATGDEVYGNDLRAYKDAFKVEPTLYTVIDDPYNTISSSYGAGFFAFDTRNRGALGSLSLLLNKDKLGDGLKADELKKLSSSVTEAADKYVEMENKQGYGIPYTSYDDYSYSSYATDLYISGYEEGSDARVVNNAVIMAYAYDLTKDTGYLNGAAGAMDYLLGRNPLAFSFITGYGSYGVKNPYHSYWANSKDPEFPKAPHGVLVGGPNAYLTDNTVRGLGFVPGRSSNASQRCYVDNIESWSTNATAVEWNSPLAWVVSFLQDEGTGGVYVPEKPEATTQPVTTQPVTTDPTDIQDKGYLIGDADLDGTVGLSDITMLAKYLLSSVFVPEETADSELFLRNSDTNLDGAVDTLDLSLLIEYNLGTAQFPDIRSLIN